MLVVMKANNIFVLSDMNIELEIWVLSLKFVFVTFGIYTYVEKMSTVIKKLVKMRAKLVFGGKNR